MISYRNMSWFIFVIRAVPVVCIYATDHSPPRIVCLEMLRHSDHVTFELYYREK